MALDIIRTGFQEMFQVRIATKDELVAKGVRLDQANSPKKLTIHELFQLTFRVTGVPANSTYTLPAPDKAIGFVVIRFLQGNTFSVPIAQDTTVGSVQMAVGEHLEYSREEIRLIYGGTTITDTSDVQLRERGIGPDDVLCAIVSPIAMEPDGGEAGPPSIAYAPFYIDNDLLHPSYDYDFTSINDTGKRFMRGGYEYKRPCGWRRYALKVLGQYGGDEKWLGSSGQAGIGEWPVSYHGIQLAGRNSGDNDHEVRRDRFGRGHYSSPNVLVAEKYGTKFTHSGRRYVMVLQNRVNPNTTQMISKDRTGDLDEYWITANGEDIRAYGICIKQI